MPQKEFEQLIDEEFPNAVPEPFRHLIQNVAFLIEEEPSAELKAEEHIGPNMLLLGLYRGVSVTARGDYYGVGSTLPDTITLFQKPIEEIARARNKDVRQVIRETIWHEVAHHFGYNEVQVRGREHKDAA
jgi:predicted Zn-dependent protease with MMP-like domain